MIRPKLLFAIVLLPFFVGAQDTAEREAAHNRVHVVRASGEATVTAKPDQAEISIAVFNQAPNAQMASEQNAAEAARVLEAVKRQFRSVGQVKTGGYSISPEYQYPDRQAPKVTGYTATNTIRVNLNDLALIGKVIDAATASGANRIEGISFTLKNDEAVRSEALAEAASKARANAEAIARALNLRVIGVVEAESTQPATIRPIMMRAEAMEKAPPNVPTPVEPGTIDIHATVQVSLEVQ